MGQINKLKDKAVLQSEDTVEELFEIKSKLASIIEYSKDAIYGNDSDGLVTYWNKSAETMYGYPAEEIIGKSVKLLVPPDKIGEVSQLIDKTKKNEEIEHIESIRVKKNGERINVSISASPIKNLATETVGVAIIARDITELKRLQEAEFKMIQMLRNANANLESFSYSISHDLRAPLIAIDGFSKALENDYAKILDIDGKHIIHTIRNSTKHMGDLIDGLLSFSRLSRQEVITHDIDITKQVKEVFAELQQINPARSIQFTIKELGRAEVDSILMHQVWINLLSNAIKFTSKKDIAKITVSRKDMDNNIIYSVEDNGVGFNMKYVDKLFGVFHRLHSSQDFDGIGVGLSIVKKVIERHGGKVWAESMQDKGATFYFSLPKTRKVKPILAA